MGIFAYAITSIVATLAGDLFTKATILTGTLALKLGWRLGTTVANGGYLIATTLANHYLTPHHYKLLYWSDKDACIVIE